MFVRSKSKPRFLGDKSANQPGRGRPVNPRSWPRDPDSANIFPRVDLGCFFFPFRSTVSARKKLFHSLLKWAMEEINLHNFPEPGPEAAYSVAWPLLR